MPPLVSVIVPTYNRLVKLGELLESLSRQTFKDFEVIIANDHGESVETVCGMYKELDLHVIDMERNLRHVHARNRALQKAAGTYIMLCDDDDLLVDTHMERMLRELDGYDLVYSDAEIVHFEWDGESRKPVSRSVFAYDDDLEAMRRFSTFVSSGAMYRRAIHEELGLFDPEVYHYWDWDFFLRVSAAHKIKRVPVAGVLYAFAAAGSGDNLSADHESMKPYLDLLSKKHQLGELPTKNFFLLLEEPEIVSRRAETSVIWDGKPFPSRYRQST